MKTNQVLTRQMGDFKVLQRTSDGMFNATVLLKQWNDSKKGSKKEMGDYFRIQQTEEFVTALISEEDFKDGNSPYLKSRGKYNGGTWMHPLLFIDFAMWINPAFKVKVLRFVYDQLIKNRNDAGDTYKDMCSAVAKISNSKNIPVSVSIQNTSRALNCIVFGMHETNIRNKKAEETLLMELVELQRKVTSLIDEGFIKDYNELISYLRKLWTKKWRPKCLNAA